MQYSADDCTSRLGRHQGPGGTREQPPRRQPRHPQAEADRLHRGERLGQELARVPDDRRGVPAADQRDLQRVRAGLHAHAGAAGRRLARRADDGDHRGPGADGRQRPLHRRHRDRRQRDAPRRVQPARPAAHRRATGLLLQRPVGHGVAGRSPSSAAPAGPRAEASASPAACARAARAWAARPTST